MKGKLDDYLLDDSIINTEILWTLKCVMGHFSLSITSKNVGRTFT